MNVKRCDEEIRRKNKLAMFFYTCKQKVSSCVLNETLSRTEGGIRYGWVDCLLQDLGVLLGNAYSQLPKEERWCAAQMAQMTPYSLRRSLSLGG